jgi:hypothetical protein
MVLRARRPRRGLSRSWCSKQDRRLSKPVFSHMRMLMGRERRGISGQHCRKTSLTSHERSVIYSRSGGGFRPRLHNRHGAKDLAQLMDGVTVSIVRGSSACAICVHQRHVHEMLG